jgi:hypothetical protein
MIALGADWRQPDRVGDTVPKLVAERDVDQGSEAYEAQQRLRALFRSDGASTVRH